MQTEDRTTVKVKKKTARDIDSLAKYYCMSRQALIETILRKGIEIIDRRGIDYFKEVAGGENEKTEK